MVLQDLITPNVHQIDADIWAAIKYLMVLFGGVIVFFLKDALASLNAIRLDIAAMKEQSKHTSETVDSISQQMEEVKKTVNQHDQRITYIEKILK